MKQREKGRRGRPKVIKPEGQDLDRVSIMLTDELRAYGEDYAREISERDGVSISLSEAIREMMGFHREMRGRK